MSITNTQALVLLINTKRICIEAMAPIIGEEAAMTAFDSPAAGSIAARLNTLQATFDAAPTTFVNTPANLTELDAIIDTYSALAFDPSDDISDAVGELNAAVAV